jgi:membrane protein required for colicin V production
VTWLDGGVIILLAGSAALGLVRGFLKEVVSIAALVIGLVLAGQLYPQAAGLFSRWVEAPEVRSWMGFVAVFLAVLILAGIGIWVADRILKFAALKWVDRLLGGLFGLVRGWLVATVLVLAMGAFSFGAKTLQRSTFAPYLLTSARLAAYAVPADMRQGFQQKYAEIYRHWLDLLRSYKPEGETPPAPPPGK